MRMTVGLRARLIRLLSGDKPYAAVSRPETTQVDREPVCSAEGCERHGEGSC